MPKLPTTAKLPRDATLLSGPAMLLPGPCNAAAGPAMLLPGPCNVAAGLAMLLPGPCNAAAWAPQCYNRAWPCRDLLLHDPALTMVFDPDIGSDHVTRSCYSIMLLIHVTRSCYSFLLLDPVTHSCYSIRSVLIDSLQQSNPLYDRSHVRPCRFNRQVHASIYIYIYLY